MILESGGSIRIIFWFGDERKMNPSDDRVYRLEMRNEVSTFFEM
jgi:hypothetical protein